MPPIKSIIPAWAIWIAFVSVNGAGPALALDNTKYCNAVQGKVGFIRHPLGALGAWSTDFGEVADVMTRVPRVYPCLNSVVVKPVKDDWRASITGDPSMLSVKYQPSKPSGASTATITVSPHVAVFTVAFPPGAENKYLVFDFGKGRVDPWAALNKWTNRKVTRIDNRTLQATIGEPGRSNACYLIRFSRPCAGSGTIDSSGAITEGADTVAGAGAGMYARFEDSTVTVAIAESFTSMAKAAEFLASEFAGFDGVRRNCQAAWNEVLDRVEIEGPETSKRMAYTALYTMFVNLIGADDGSCYSKYYPRPRSLASSAYWQFIGGFQSCCWDNFRTAYPFLMLAYPEVMSDVVNTYLAKYQRDGCVNGNTCLFAGPTGDHTNMRFSPVLIAQACNSGIQADYPKLYAALKDNFDSTAYVPAGFLTLGYVTQPATGGKACSETLEFATGMGSMAVLAKAVHDEEGARRYTRLSKSYTNVWDGANKVFRVKNADGAWGPINNTNWTWNPNPQGLFEGTTKDWMFAVPHDPYGLIDLPGQERLVERVVEYCLNDTWFNDYQYHYPYLLYYAGAPNEAQRIIRDAWVPLFQQGILYEGVRPKPPHNGWQTHYTSNAGWLLCSMLGLYPVPAPAGQYIISSPSVTKAVIHHAGKKITLQTKDNTGRNIYVRSIKVDGKVYPAYMIAARRLAAGVTMELEMGSDPAQGLGSLFIGSSDGLILDAELVSPSRLKCVVEAGATDATTRIYSRTKPAKVVVNGTEDNTWSYDEAKQTIRVHSAGTAAMEVWLR